MVKAICDLCCTCFEHVLQQLKENKNMETMNNQNYTSIFPPGNPGPADWFSGEVHVQSLVAPDQMEG